MDENQTPDQQQGQVLQFPGNPAAPGGIVDAGGKPVGPTPEERQNAIKQMFANIDEMLKLPGATDIGAAIMSCLRLYAWVRELLANFPLPDAIPASTKDAYLRAIMAESFDSQGRVTPFDDEALLATLETVVFPLLKKDMERNKALAEAHQRELEDGFALRVAAPLLNAEAAGFPAERGAVRIREIPAADDGPDVRAAEGLKLLTVLAKDQPDMRILWLTVDGDTAARISKALPATALVVQLPAAQPLDKVQAALANVVATTYCDVVVCDRPDALTQTALKSAVARKQTVFYVVTDKEAPAIRDAAEALA